MGRAFPPYESWARISMGLPEENGQAQAAVRNCWPPRKEAAKVEFGLERDTISIVRGQLVLNSSADASAGVTTCRF